jgi:hypothetical protein
VPTSRVGTPSIRTHPDGSYSTRRKSAACKATPTCVFCRSYYEIMKENRRLAAMRRHRKYCARMSIYKSLYLQRRLPGACVLAGAFFVSFGFWFQPGTFTISP